MKKCLLLVLFPFWVMAQQMPVSENNVFTYNKYNYGYDFLNVNYLFQDPFGGILGQPYGGDYFTIGNTRTAHTKQDIATTKGNLGAVFFQDKKTYLCTTYAIYCIENKKTTSVTPVSSKIENTVLYFYNDNKIYIQTYYYEENTVTLSCYENGVITKFKQFKTDDYFVIHLTKHNNHLYLFLCKENSIAIYDVVGLKIIPLKTIPNIPYIGNLLDFKSIDDFSFENQKNYIRYKNGKVEIDRNVLQNFGMPFVKQGYFSTNSGNNKYIFKCSDPYKPIINTSETANFFPPVYSPQTNSFYVGTQTQLARIFEHIKKYPRLFYNNNSNSVFSLQQDSHGAIWAGSYQGILSVINKDKVLQSKEKNVRFMNGGMPYKDKILLLGESNKGLLLFDSPDHFKTIADSVTGFCTYISKADKLYLGTSNMGLWETDASDIETSKKVLWNKITDKQGMLLTNVLDVCEDKFGNIWMGRSNQGISVYNVKTKKAITWLSEKKQIDFKGSMSMLMDDKNTLWFGAGSGELVCYNVKSSTDYNPKNFIKIKHPLLGKSDKPISFIKQWKDYLIIGSSDKVLLFDLKKWNNDKTVSVRYLNPMETNFTSSTEQNTILTDKRDESIWFATSDMVYQWNINKWLTLPTLKVTPNIIIKKDSVETEYSQGKNIGFKSTENSFDIQIQFQTKDNMPRFLNGVLVKKEEAPVFENPNVETKFHYANLSAGDYIFYVRICQQDGSYDVFKYPMTIDNFLWQNWWFWVLLSVIPIGFIVYYFQKKNEIEKQKKRLSQLNLSSLSNQFRPHFMLNALNSIGSQLEDKPHAERVISRLGESITILYGFTQKNEFTHPFNNEWKLVENIIEIQNLLFIPDLEVTIIGKEIIAENYKVPVGIIQIPVENALLHGLRNKENEISLLKIEISDTKDNYIISIRDNGVGRKKAAQMNNFKNNGNGLKTVFEMIKIINQHQPKAINFTITDLKNEQGTLVTIELKKDIDYEKIKL